jgi:hypothetical protein
MWCWSKYHVSPWLNFPLGLVIRGRSNHTSHPGTITEEQSGEAREMDRRDLEKWDMSKRKISVGELIRTVQGYIVRLYMKSLYVLCVS